MAANESKLWYLEKMNIFSNLTEEELQQVDRVSKMSSIEKGKFIYFPNDPSKVVFLLKRGKVKLGSYSSDGKELIKAILEPGEVFGELAVTGQEHRSDFAQAMTDDVRICAVQKDEMLSIMSEMPKLNQEITRTIGDRMLKLQRRYESLVFKDARERIIDFVVDTTKEKGFQVGFGMKLKHDLTHQDIAQLTATSRQTVTLVLNELKEKELINFDRGSILIHDMKAMENAV